MPRLNMVEWKWLSHQSRYNITIPVVHSCWRYPGSDSKLKTLVFFSSFFNTLFGKFLQEIAQNDFGKKAEILFITNYNFFMLLNLNEIL